jgi:exodeoxyribonuclease III
MPPRIPSSLNIISWNVASWTTTATNIAKQHGSVATWLDRHNIDILCLQEVKATRQKLLSTNACNLNPNHWDMFLSPCTSRPGLNGVATIVRKNRFRGEEVIGSLPTVGAESKPFGIADLDNQGRCILTDHGAFTLINVYVPYDGEKGVQMGLKIRFLDALHDLIKKVQRTGRSVICVGDFNVARYPRDVHYEFRRINIEDIVSNFEANAKICEAKIGYPANNEVLDLLTFLRDNWTPIQTTLNDRKIVEFSNGNGGDKNKIIKYVLKVGAKSTQIGPRQTSSGACETTANPAAILTADGYVYKPFGVLSAMDLFEVLSKLFQKDYTEQAKIAFSDTFGEPRSCGPVRDHFDRLMTDCELRDTYIHANPAGRQLGSERFTCWDQYRNERYENKGARIDYIFVDSQVINSVRLVETEDHFMDPLKPLSISLNPLAISSERGKSIAAATAEGRWRPVPFIGGGIDMDPPSAAARDFEYIYTNPPQTGIVYTAPQFSDHVGTSCVLDMKELSTQGINDRLNDELGIRWKSSLPEAHVVDIKPKTVSHSLKDMFRAMSSKTEVVCLADSFEEVKKQKLA